MDTKIPKTFILGAGFSAEQQFPLMKDLKDRVIHFIEAEQHYRYVDHIRPDGNFPKGKFYEGLEYIDPEKNLGFEELLIKLSAHLKYDPCYLTNQVLRIGAARLFWCITFFIERFEDCYTNFAHGLKKNEGEWKVVTFNWDILVEKSLSDIGASWRYSLTPNDKSIPIIKPHGSINWSSFAHNAIVSKYSGWKPIGVDSTLSYDACRPLENPDLADQNDNFRYCLYPGDLDWPEAHADLERLWKDVHGAIQSAEKVIFIGYSLPEYDSYAGSAFRELCKNKAVEVYDPSSATLERFHKAFPHAKLERLGFKDSPYALRPTRTA
jgi:hypothetical protein